MGFLESKKMDLSLVKYSMHGFMLDAVQADRPFCLINTHERIG